MDKHKKLNTAMVVYDETAVLVKSTLTDIHQEHDKLRSPQATPNPGGASGGYNAVASKTKARKVKIDDTFKPG